MSGPLIHQPLLRKAIITTCFSLEFISLGFLHALLAVCVSNKALFGEAPGKFFTGLGLLATGIFEFAIAVAVRTAVGYAKVVNTFAYFPFVIIPTTYQLVLGQSQYRTPTMSTPPEANSLQPPFSPLIARKQPSERNRRRVG
jgi:hypothetical protein